MTYDKIYYPYPATDRIHKYFIITSQGKKVSFGAKGYNTIQSTRIVRENSGI